MWHGQRPGATAATSAGSRPGVTTSQVGEIRAGRGLAARGLIGRRRGAETARRRGVGGVPQKGMPEEGVSVAMTADVPKGPAGPDQREVVRARSADVRDAAATVAADRVEWCHG